MIYACVCLQNDFQGKDSHWTIEVLLTIQIDEVKATMVKVAEAKSKMVKKGQALREAGEMVDAVQEKARVTRREREKMKYRVSGIKQMITSLKIEKWVVMVMMVVVAV